MTTAKLRAGRAALLATLVLALAPPSGAVAVHWPFFGGDQGRSGYQPVDEGVAPVTFRYSKTDASEQLVRTSIVTSTGPAGQSRLAFGTQAGFAHLQLLESGAPVGPEAGVNLDDPAVDDADTFGGAPGAPGSVSFADTSGMAQLGQLYVAHNDDDAGGPEDIQVAQIDEPTGAVLAERRVEGTDGFTISSSPVVGAPDSSGNRALFFIAANGADSRLFRVPLGLGFVASSGTATATNTGNIGATPVASPAIVFLDSGGTSTQYVAVGTGSDVLTFSAADLSPGPRTVSGALSGPVQTPSVPVQPTGFSPNPNGPVTRSPFIYVAGGGAGTTAYKLQQSGPDLTVVATSDPLLGAPAPALAVTQEAEVDQDDGKVLVTTGANLYLLSTTDLDGAGRFAPSSVTLNPGTTGFSQTTAAASGDLIYVTNDQSEQLVLRLLDGKRVRPADFAPATGPSAPGSGYGQPSISRGLVQFGGGGGLFVYRNVDVTAPTIALAEPPDGARLTGTVTLSAEVADARGVASVSFGLNGALAGTATTPDAAARATQPGAVIFSVELDSTSLRNGEYLLVAQARDAAGNSALTPARRVEVRNLVAGPCANETQGTASAETIEGTEAGDRLLGLEGDDLLRGLQEVDCLLGGPGRDRLIGGTGDDQELAGENGADTISGGRGADTGSGGRGNDRLIGGPGPDSLSGGGGNDRLFGQDGPDRLSGGSGTNTYSGEGGNDRIEARNGLRETVDCGRGRDTVRADRRERVRGCEQVLRGRRR